MLGLEALATCTGGLNVNISLGQGRWTRVSLGIPSLNGKSEIVVSKYS